MLTISLLHNHRKLTLFTLALGLSVFPQTLRAHFGLALSPMRTELNLPAGAQRNGSLALANDDLQTNHFRVDIFDLSIDREAVPQFEKNIPEEKRFSCKDWVTVNPMEGDVPSKGQMMVRYTFRVPPNAPTLTYHCALGFTAITDPKKQESMMGIQSLLCLASTFYITVGNPVPTGEVRKIDIEKFNAKDTAGYRAIISVENSGLTNLRGAGKVDVVDEGGEVVQASDFPPVVILPSRTQRLPVVLNKKLADGNYTLRARVNLGNGEIQEAVFKFRLPMTQE